MVTPMVLSSNVTALLIAVFSGAAASLVAGYASRPKTNAEAKKENATADVSMSGDAREWATFWADKAKVAEDRAAAAEDRADSADERVAVLERDRNTLIDYTKLLEIECESRGATLPPLPARIRAIMDNPHDF